MKPRLHLAALAVGLATAPAAHAADDMFRFSGFGTIGLAHSTEDHADVPTDFQNDFGVGASHGTTGRLDSRLAVQVDATFTDNFSGVLQAVSEYAVTASYRPEVSMAHVRYRFSPKFSARLGRINAPLYMLSEFQRVGYAHPWARPPAEVYDYLLPMDGIEGLYTINAGDTVVGLQAFYGEIDSERAWVDDFRGLTVTADRGASSARISHIRGRVGYSSTQLDALFDAYARMPVPGLGEVVERLSPYNVDGSFSSLGYSYDPGHWFVRAEAVRADYEPSILGRTTSGYLSAGVRRGAWTPSFTFAHLEKSGADAPGALDPVGLLNGAVAQTRASRHSYTASLRWDVRDSVAVKLQGSHVRNHAGSYGDLGNFQPGFQPGRSYNLVSATVDFVF